MSRAAACFVVFSAVILSLLLPGGTQAATVKQLEDSINRAKARLYAQQQQDGSWEQTPKTIGDINSDPRGMQWGGYTAIATYALLAAGESPNDPRLARAIEFLKTAELKGTYAIALRCQVWLLIGKGKDLQQYVKKDAEALLSGMYASGPHAGMFSYGAGASGPQPRGHFDHSVSQYGVLGLWAADQAGYEVPSQIWRMIDQAWRADQHKDGGWAYSDFGGGDIPNSETASMTAAGVGTLFITQDRLPVEAVGCRSSTTNDNTERGLLWMDKHIDQVFASHRMYTMYGIERIGTASGRKYFSTHAWYDGGAEMILEQQKPTGDWGSLPDTCFALLFLVRGRAPVMINKLQYNVASITGRAAYEGAWNDRPRDVAYFTRWMSHNLERDLNWQIVNLKVSADDLHDAPLLYIAGSDELSLADSAMEKLRDYVRGGGMILANADCGKKPFADSFVAMGRKLFPNYAFRELERNHPIYTNEQFPAAGWKDPQLVLALGNGVREFMILVPQADLGRAWAFGREQGHEQQYQLGADIFVYATDKKDLRFRGESPIVNADPKIVATRELRIARLDAGGNWDPEPGGWRRLAAIMHNENGADLLIDPVRLGADPLNGFKIAHLTGTTTLQLTPTQRSALTNFVKSGGTLIVDAAGGSPLFAASAEKELALMFPAGAGELATPLPSYHALYTNSQSPIADFTYRTFIHKNLHGDIKSPRLRGITINGRVAVFFSREDLSAGLVGQQVDGILGYSPETATAIMRNILLYAGPTPATHPVTQPATEPANTPRE